MRGCAGRWGMDIHKDLAEELKLLEKLVPVRDIRDVFVSLCERCYLRGNLREKKESRRQLQNIIRNLERSKHAKVY